MKLITTAVQRAAERRLRVPADYLGRMGETSFGALMKFVLFMPLSMHRRRTAPAPLHAARIVATQHEDCGPCVQIAVNAALDDGVAPELIRAVLRGDLQDLPEEVALAVRFARGVLARDGSEADARGRIEELLGPAVVTELSLAIATARVFPTAKRGMGFARSCSLVEISVEPGSR